MAERLVKLYRNRAVATLGALAMATTVCTAMVAARVLYTGAPTFRFLLWNLFLAWVPFLISFALYRFRVSSPAALLLGGAAWLLFFPNAPYIVTDFIHLRRSHSELIWYDAIMIASFAWTGLTLGLVSLRMMQSIVRERVGRLASWVFAPVVLLLSSFGVYLGRFQRWNSWDAIVRPYELLHDARGLVHPSTSTRAVALTVLFATFLMVTYVMTSTLLARRADAGEQEF
jgi:uncharacterized membrane protein